MLIIFLNVFKLAFWMTECMRENIKKYNCILIILLNDYVFLLI